MLDTFLFVMRLTSKIKHTWKNYSKFGIRLEKKKTHPLYGFNKFVLQVKFNTRIKIELIENVFLAYRNVIFHLSTPKPIKTNPRCIIKNTVVCDRSDPQLVIDLIPEVHGKGIKFETFFSFYICVYTGSIRVEIPTSFFLLLKLIDSNPFVLYFFFFFIYRDGRFRYSKTQYTSFDGFRNARIIK